MILQYEYDEGSMHWFHEMEHTLLQHQPNTERSKYYPGYKYRFYI